MTLSSLFLLAGVVVGTWNGNWFPSGRAEHRAHPDVEAATIGAAGKLLAKGLAEADPSGTNDVIICVNEVRGPRVAKELCAAIGRKDLKFAVITGYRRRDRFDTQQDVILTTLPVASANWAVWKTKGKVRPPRGYAHASLVVAPAVTAEVYAVHLKSDYGAGKDAALKAENRAKRELCAAQLAEMAKIPRGASAAFALRPFILAGDFNADPWHRDFADEATFHTLAGAGYANALAELPPEGRGSYFTKRYGARALDLVFQRGAKSVAKPVVVPSEELSDHAAVFVLMDF